VVRISRQEQKWQVRQNQREKMSNNCWTANSWSSWRVYEVHL